MLRVNFLFSIEKYLSSFLDLLLQLNEEGAQFSNTDIRDEVITMMIGVRIIIKNYRNIAEIYRLRIKKKKFFF